MLVLALPAIAAAGVLTPRAIGPLTQQQFHVLACMKPPTFDRALCLDLAGGQVYRQAEKLFESHAVLAAEWRSPVLVGKVKGAAGVYAPRLNLRSTVCAENQCNCPIGKKGRICSHAIAVALHFQALQREARQAAEADAEVVPVESPVAPSAPRIRSFKLDAQGPKLRLLVFLPPNLEAAAARNAIVVKLDAAAGREIVPLNKLSRAAAYAVSPAQQQAIVQIESWCGGKLAGLLQLTKARLLGLLAALQGEPVVYWIKKPAEPIAWQGSELPGVHVHLPLSEAETAEAARQASAEQSAVADQPVKQRISAAVSLRGKSKINPRRAAEARAQGLFRTRPGDFPAVQSRDPMVDYPANRIVVDGSLNFIAIRLPAGRDDESILPLRNLLKSEGFQLEPSNRKWWLRDRHKTLNFLAGHWRSLKDSWRALFTEAFEAKLAAVHVSAIDVSTREENGRFNLEVRLAEGQGETELRKAIATGKNYVRADDGRITLLDRKSVEQLHLIEKSVSGQADRPFTPTFSKQLDAAELVDVEGLLDELCEGWQPPQAWQSRSRALKQVGALEPAPLRAGFDATLRSYQRIGVAWLWHLYRHQLGGILADEMGLGRCCRRWR